MNNSYISPSVIEDCCKLILDIKVDSVKELNFKIHKDLFVLNDKKIIYNFLDFIEFDMRLNHNNNSIDKQELRRFLLKSYIKKINPHWIKRIKWGIETEVFNFLKTSSDNYNLYHSLLDSNLISYDKNTIRWWYNEIFENDDKKLINTGLDGEFLSIKYESEILNINKDLIDHMSLKKSDVGYDIKSIINKNINKPKPIEVKSISNPNYPFIYLTINEWKKSIIPNYLFHIWFIENKMSHLYFLDRNNLKKHIPVNTGKGSWETTKIDVTNLIGKKICSLDNEIDNF
jgi:hypothetical protein